MTSNKVVSNGFGALAALPEELLVDVTTKDCKGCCDGDDKTQKFSSSDSGIGTETTTERETREKRGESFLDRLTSSSGSSGRSGSSGSSSGSRSSGTFRTQSGKTIKDYKSLTIGSLDLGTSGKDCPEQDKIEEKIRNIMPKPDIFFIQNKKGNKRIFNEIYTNEFNAKDDKGPQVSVYSNRYLDGTSKTKTASASNPPQSGILYFTNDKYTIANIQLNSEVYKDGIKDILKTSTKEGLTKYNDDFTKYEKELKQKNKGIQTYIIDKGKQVDESRYKSEL